MELTNQRSKKICLVGDFAVGKTSLVRRYVDNQFSDQYLSTVGVKISRKLVQLPTSSAADTHTLQLLIWDIEGSDRFKSVESSYLKGASGAIIVADLSRRDTLPGVDGHIQQFLQINPKAFVVVAFNKADLVHDPAAVATVTFAGYDRVLGTHLTSAKNGDGIVGAFAALSNVLLEL